MIFSEISMKYGTNNLLRGFQNQFTLEVVSKTSSETVSKQVCSESRGESKGMKNIHHDEPRGLLTLNLPIIEAFTPSFEAKQSKYGW